MVPAAGIINGVVLDLKYTRAHVAKIFRANSARLKAKKSADGRGWLVPADKTFDRLVELVKRESGRRYKKGERGPRAKRK